MIRFRFITLAAALMVAPLAYQIACKQKSEAQQTDDLTKKVAEAERAEKESKYAQSAQAQALQKAGVQTMGETVQLTPEQRSYLEQRVKEEKRSDTAALLQEILDRDKKISELEKRVSSLRAELPAPQIASERDNHYAMGLRFLRSKGVNSEKARTLLAKVNLMEELQPGWQVYNYYDNGVYLTTVGQGRSRVSPAEYVKERRIALERERDESKTVAHDLNNEVERLVAERTKVTEEIDSLRMEKSSLMGQVNDLNTLSESQKKKLNSMHYLIGKRKQLEEDGVIVIPVFAKDRMGPKATVARFDKDLPLDGTTPAEVVITAADAGITKVSKVNVVPGSLIKGQHYAVDYASDGSSATVKILDPERLKNDRVAFAVTD